MENIIDPSISPQAQERLAGAEEGISQDQEQQPTEGYNPYGYQIDPKRAELIQTQQDLRSEVTDLCARLGYVFDTEKMDWVCISAEPLINKKGLLTLMPLISSHVSKLQIMTHNEKDDIDYLMYNCMVTVIDQLRFYYQEWGLDERNLSNILVVIESSILSTMNRGKLGGERDYVNQSYNAHNTLVQPQRKQSVWGRLFGG